ncbi:MAG: GTP cyclohydrolase I FolE2 [Deltaproteobacteria bacterium]|nr:GTP cyclohydrolase I FolE2 [Deltaproteobacteria bacterium]MBW2041686.1 GTP cyclohydrolase I FolE2 [Deltaproteobacteria bacterium]MBW2131748.1 GTP cyclohydrolase I FolE2 [Deltaproteobacteria bacterium]
MIDIQNQRDDRNISIDNVGIKNLRYPVTVRDRRDGFQHTVATINMYVDLPHRIRGTHMSRFVEILHSLSPEVSLRTFSKTLEKMKDHLNAASAHVEMTFPYFIEKKAPVSRSPGLMDYTCRIIGSSDSNGKVDLISEVIVPISSVCPCSKEISDAGAHNQRGEVRLKTRFKKFIWLEDMIELVEASSSCDVYSVLKRVDEKEVTERGFTNAKFVEDVVRDIAKKLLSDNNITWFSVSAENFESIHNHSAYAHITRNKMESL